MSASTTASQVLQVKIPDGMLPGSDLHFQTPDGRIFAIIIPEGIHGGDVITVEIHEMRDGGAQVVLTTEAIALGEERKQNNDGRAKLGAAAVGAVLGTVLMGPLTGILVGAVALYACTQEGKVGEVTRKTGETVVDGCEKIADACVKNKVGEKIVDASKKTYQKTLEIDEKYHISENVKQAAHEAYSEAKRINEKYDITGNASKALISGYKAASDAVSKVVSNDQKQIDSSKDEY